MRHNKKARFFLIGKSGKGAHKIFPLPNGSSRKQSEKKMGHSEKELEILEKIHKSKDSVRQRDLAKIAGLSLGMTNAIIKRLMEKGFVTVKKVNNRNIKYAVSPLGIEEISKRSFKYFKRTIRNVVVYKEAIEELLEDIKKTGYTKIILVGNSDIDFIIEHICVKKTMQFVRETAEDPGIDEKDSFFIFSERIEPERNENRKDLHEKTDRKNCEYLKKLLVG